MSLRTSTIANANNRHRFVTPAMALPYLTDRMRKNLQRAARQAEAARDAAIRAPVYGTEARCARANKILDAALWHVEIEERLAAFPPPGEARRQPTPSNEAAYEPVIDRFAAD